MSSLSKIKLDQLATAIGYSFSDHSLLIKALSHRSIGRQNNERLEFLGDSLLNFIIADALFVKFPGLAEGDLSRLRANLVKGETLAEIARQFALGDFLILGEGELKSGGFRRASILADAVESLLGAIYLESGLEVCRSTIHRWFGEKLDSLEPDSNQKDSKTRLQEFLQERKRPLPTYAILQRLGVSHSPAFEVSCDIGGGLEPTTAIASSKRQAEKLAAEKMLKCLGVKA
ncbi:RNAse III [Alteromonadaceae bacterium Bs31]|nr:RNAse III [Alteromonadaceae bacterium Bs31]